MSSRTPQSSTSFGPFQCRRRSIPRRQFLRGASVLLGLPLLEAMTPALSRRARSSEAPRKPRRLLAICNNLGILPGGFFPTRAGSDYSLSPYLKGLRDYRDDFTVLSGVSHPSVDGSHASDVCFLTAAPHPGSGSFRNSISLDQFLADRIGHLTRFPSLTLGVNVDRGIRSLSWTGSGVLIPCQEKASSVYRQMFLQGSEKEIEHQIRKLQLGESILDAVADQARSLRRRVGPLDGDRLDQYLTGVRELERRMTLSREWERRPKPRTSAPMPLDPTNPRAYMEKVRLMYEMARLAFETDSTRAVTLMLDGVNSPTIDVEGTAITDGYHNLSHHGKSDNKLAQLKAIDEWHMKLLGELFGKLKSAREGDGPLLDRTLILYGSNLGDANTHATQNMPVLLAGGGFRHGQHLAFNTQKNYPLPNLFVSLVQRMGVDTDRFASSTGSMRGLEFA